MGHDVLRPELFDARSPRDAVTASSQPTWRLGPPMLLDAPSAPAQPKAVAAPVPLRRAQRACYDALGHALKEGNVFAAVTGPLGSGKTTVLEAVLADNADRSLRCIRIHEPDRVTAMLARQIEAVAAEEADKPENRDRHIVLAIDDAHGASEELLHCLARLAAMREPGRRVPQVLLAGLPDFWTRLAATEYEPLQRRIAVRTVLPEVGQDEDPWEIVEQDVRSTMATSRQNEVLAPEPVLEEGSDPPFGLRRGGPALHDAGVAPPDLFALFPNAPPAVARRPAGRRRSKLALLALVPVGCAMAAAIAFWAMDEWPDLWGNLLLQSRSAETAQLVPAPVVPAPVLSAPVLSAPVAAAPVTPTLSTPTLSTSPVAAARPAERSPERPAERSGTDALPAGAPAQAPVMAPALASAAVTAAATTPAPASAPVPRLAPLSAATLATLLKRGEEQEGLGDISSARLLYERAAEQGDAVAALRLGRSFDPAFLPAIDAATFADRAAARDWYSRAAALGNKDAAARLQDWNRKP